MSLINDALKKAQRQRSTDSAPPLPAVSAAQPPTGKVIKRAKPIAFQSQVVRMAATVLGAGLLLIGGVLYWQWKSFAAEELALGKLKSSAKTAATPTATEGNALSATTSNDAPKDSNASAAPAFNISTATATPPPPVIKEIVAEPAPAAPVQVFKARPDPKVLAYVDTLRVTGIRAAGSDSKVLMNDRVYRVNDIVDHALGLKLAGVATNALTFEDERGVVYTRNF